VASMSGLGVKGAARAKLPSPGMRPGHPRSLPATRRKKRLSPKAAIRGSGRVKVRAAVGIAGDKGKTPGSSRGLCLLIQRVRSKDAGLVFSRFPPLRLPRWGVLYPAQQTPLYRVFVGTALRNCCKSPQYWKGDAYT